MTGKVVLPGGAGLVGQNLVPRLKARGFGDLVVIDKHAGNLAILGKLHPDVTVINADLSQPGDWEEAFSGAQAVVMLQAQIGGLRAEEFHANNIVATERILAAMKRASVPQLVHVSSSVVRSVADDFYTRSKTLQEEIVVKSGIDATILRPTLMFGWFDRKHLGWLSRFMAKVPVFPIPGDGRYIRQPLYAGDFSEIIASVLSKGQPQGIYGITGFERVTYIDLLRAVRSATRQKTPFLCIPFGLFKVLLSVWAIFDRNPPFTAQQLDALVAGDEFEVIDWPAIFGVTPTPLAEAMEQTFRHPLYSGVVLDF